MIQFHQSVSDILSEAEICEGELGGEDSWPHSVLKNLLVLYWQSTDSGFVASNNLPQDFVDHASSRLQYLLSRIGMCVHSPDLDFWKKYIQWADLGEDLDIDWCTQLLGNSTCSKDPVVYIFPATYGRLFREEALQLLDETSDGKTARERYIHSVLVSALRLYG